MLPPHRAVPNSRTRRANVSECARASRRTGCTVERLEGRTLLAGNPGDLDPSFGGDGVVVQQDEGFGRLGVDVAAAAGGKLVTIELEHTQPGVTTRVVRYNPDGTRDASFAGGVGAVVEGVSYAAVADDGKVWLAGRFYVVRLNADGTFDNAFGSGGRSDITNGIAITDIAAAPGGKVVGSYVTDADRRAMQAFRLTGDGSYDTTFGGDGFVTIDPLAGSTTNDDFAGAEAVVVRPDGRVALAAGLYRTDGVNYAGGRFAVAQFTAGGEPDASFGGGDGLAITEFPAGFARAQHLALAPDGKLVAAGVFVVQDPERYDLAVARYNPDGSLDATFSGDGLHTQHVGFQSSQTVNGLEVQADGKVLLAGYGHFDGEREERDFYALRLTAGGQPDTTWGDGGGVAVTDFFAGDDSTQAAALDTAGRLVVIGETFAENMRNRGAVRYTTAGKLDTTFSGDGRIADDFAETHREASATVVQPDGKVVVAGSWRGAGKPNSFKSDFYLTRYDADGSLDASFGAGGRAWTDFGNRIDVVNDLLLQPDGKLVAVGSSVSNTDPRSQADLVVARYNSDGSPDASFSGDGKLTRDLGADDAGVRVVRRGDGDLIVSATSNTAGDFTQRWALLRVNADGSLDNALDGDGVLFHAYGAEVALQSDNKMVLAVYEPGDTIDDGDGGSVVTRLNPDGSLDATFDGDGRTGRIDIGSPGSESILLPRQLLVTGDKILLLAQALTQASEGTGGVSLLRFNPDGSFDPTFGGGDGRTMDLPTGFARVEDPAAMAVDGKGRIVIVGVSERGEQELVLMRYTADGVLDASFGDANARAYLGEFTGPRDVAIAPGDHPVVAGVAPHATARFLGEPAAGGPGGPGSPAAAPEVSVLLEGDGSALFDSQPDAVEFGTWVLGQSGATRRFVVRNDGTAPLQLGAVTVPAGFSVTEPLAATLAPGESDGFTVALDTATAGERTGAVGFATNDADENPFNFNLSGAIAAPGSTPDTADITVLLDGVPVTPGQAIDFGTAAAGGNIPGRTITLRNDGAAPLTLGTITVPAGFLIADGPENLVLAPGASTTIRVDLTTAAAGTFTGAASVASNDPDENPLTLQLSGVVTGVSAAEPAPLQVGNVSARLPAVVIAGDRRARGRVAFTISNTTAAFFAGPVTFAAHASADAQPGGSDVQLTRVTRRVKLKAGAARTMRLSFRFPQTMPAGDQNVLVSATAAIAGANSTDTETGPAMSVRAPFVRLTGLPAAAPVAKPLTFGRRATFAVPLQNLGNVPTSRTPVTYTLVVSRDGTDAGQVFQTTATGRIGLRPGASRPQRVTVTFPPGAFTAGPYTLIVRLSTDLNQTNGETVALIPFAIA